MSLLVFKIIAGISVFALILICGLIPLRFAARKQHLLHLGDAFAGGIFLSAGLLHLLPEAEQGFREIYGAHGYPLAQLLCVVAFVFLLLMERGAAVFGKYITHNKININELSGFTTDSHQQCNCRHGAAATHKGAHEHCEVHHDVKGGSSNKNIITPYLLLLTLSVHSFIGGAAVGISNSFADALVIYLAIIMHKGSESIALVSNLYRYAVNPKRIGRIIFFFALLTPLGIFSASLIDHVLHLSSGCVIEAVFNAIAAGTFLYLGSVHIMECEKSFEDLGEITALVLGIILMSVVAIWV